jgi:S-DNA-T family DNA segregation ATPase FtsK/SpoIIIE
MANKVYTDFQDEQTIASVLRQGLQVPGAPKWTVLRLALARSLRLPSPPDAALDRRESTVGGGEYALEQMTGEGKPNDEDYTDVLRAMLSLHHDVDLFADDDAFVRYLQRHVRRGLREFRTSWMESHDFHNYLLHDILGDTSPAVTAKAADEGERLLRALAEIGVPAEIVERFDGPRLTRFHVRLRDTNDHGVLTRGLEKLAFALGLGEAGVFLSVTREPKIAGLDVPRPPELWQTAGYVALANWLNESATTSSLPVFLGQSVTGKPFAFDLATAPHLLLGGTTGSGKSVALHALLLSLIGSRTAAQLRLLLIDPKRVELAPYAALPHTDGGEVLTDAADALMALNDLVVEMEAREVSLARVGARDVDDPAAVALALPRIVVVVEELADLIMQSGAIEEPLVRLAQKARATGIHLVLATQRPDAQTFSGLLRSNIPSRIALTVQKGAESRIILDEVGAEKLLGRGDMLVKLTGQAAQRVHGVLIGPDDIAQAIGAAKRRGT